MLDANLRDFDTAYALLQNPHGFIDAIKAGIRELRGGNPSDGDAGHVLARVTFEKHRFGTLRDAILDRDTPGGGGGGPVVQPGPGSETALALGYVAWHANELTVGATINDAAGIRFARPASGDSALGKVSFNEERIDSVHGNRKFIERGLIIGSEGDLSFHVSDGQGGDDRNMKKLLTLAPHGAQFHVPVNIPGSGGGGGTGLPGGELYVWDFEFAEGGRVANMHTVHFIKTGSFEAVEGVLHTSVDGGIRVEYGKGNASWRDVIRHTARRALPAGVEPPA